MLLVHTTTTTTGRGITKQNKKQVKNKESPSRTRKPTLTRTTTYDHLTDRHNVKNDRLTNKNGDTLYLTSDHAVTPIAQADAREPAGYA